MSERPGGFAPNHRRVRRQEEIIWIREQGFTRVVSLLPSPHNLHNYDEAELAWRTSRSPRPTTSARRSSTLLPRTSTTWLRAGERLLVHQEELGDRVWAWWPATCCGPAGCPAARRPSPWSSSIIGHPMGPPGRDLVARAVGARRPGATAVPTRTVGRAPWTGPHRAARPAGRGHPRRRCPRSATGPSPSRSTSTSTSTWPRPAPTDDLADTVDYGAAGRRRGRR